MNGQQRAGAERAAWKGYISTRVRQRTSTYGRVGGENWKGEGCEMGVDVPYRSYLHRREMRYPLG